MPIENRLTRDLPASVDEALKTLGANLKTARGRRDLTVQEMAERIGTSRQLVADAERGKPTTGVAVYVALLAEYGLLDQLAAVADPGKDRVGLAGALMQRSRVRHRAGET
ncbi:MAG TPA: helix-turn-helix transcriptional regulator [Myxococcales bacterium]|jgi:transcriptional regulator with XRE-family HTH domain